MKGSDGSERDFWMDHRAYTRRVTRKGALELIAALVGGALLVFPPWFEAIPWGLRVTVAIGAVGVVLLGLVLTPGATKTVSTIRVRLEDEAIVYSAGELSQSLRYRGSTITRVRRRGGRVTGLHLEAADGQSMKLYGFEHMDQLYAELASRIGENQAKTRV